MKREKKGDAENCVAVTSENCRKCGKDSRSLCTPWRHRCHVADSMVLHLMFRAFDNSSTVRHFDLLYLYSYITFYGTVKVTVLFYLFCPL